MKIAVLLLALATLAYAIEVDTSVGIDVVEAHRVKRAFGLNVGGLLNLGLGSSGAKKSDSANDSGAFIDISVLGDGGLLDVNVGGSGGLAKVDVGNESNVGVGSSGATASESENDGGAHKGALGHGIVSKGKIGGGGRIPHVEDDNASNVEVGSSYSTASESKNDGGALIDISALGDGKVLDVNIGGSDGLANVDVGGLLSLGVGSSGSKVSDTTNSVDAGVAAGVTLERRKRFLFGWGNSEEKEAEDTTGLPDSVEISKEDKKKSPLIDIGLLEDGELIKFEINNPFKG